MPEVIIHGLIEGGKATNGPPFGPALGPMGVNIGAIVAEINKETKNFEGMKVPVKVIVDSVTKKYKVEIGAPPTSALILKEINAPKGSKSKEESAGNITIEQVRKIAKSKETRLYGDERSKIKQVIGTCKSMGVKCEGKDPKEMLRMIDAGEVKV